MSNRCTLRSLKSQAYSLYGVDNTKQLKKLLGEGYDLRTRAAWLAAIGMRKRPVFTRFSDGQFSVNNIVPFNLCCNDLDRFAAENDD